jgi:two-component system response regulator
MSHDEIEILLVEDNFDDAELTIRALTKNHLASKLIHLKDGAEALDFLFGTGAFEGRKTAIVPKVILLDLKLPKVTGMEVLKKIKQNSLTEKIPVVVLTSSSQDPDIEHAYNLGANSYIVKPIEFDKFSKAISDLGMYWLVLNRHPL